MRLKLKKNSSIRKNGLYDLENIFGDCSGHGYGFGGEDIEWYIEHNNKFYKTLQIYREEDELSIYVQEIYRNGIVKNLNKNNIPKVWQNKFNKFVKEHCLK